MTTPTREQVIEWAKEAGFVTGSLNSIDPDEIVTGGPRFITDEIERLCTLAISAGREQGLREAAELMRELGRLLKGNATPTTEEAALAIESLLKRAAAIEQLRGK